MGMIGGEGVVAGGGVGGGVGLAVWVGVGVDGRVHMWRIGRVAGRGVVGVSGVGVGRRGICAGRGRVARLWVRQRLRQRLVRMWM